MTINASDFNAEYNALETAFNGTTGHDHSGGTGLGQKIPLTTSVIGVLPVANGGTGVANGTNNTLTFTGNYTCGITLTGNTSITLPTSGTLLTTGVTSMPSLTTIGTIGTGVWQGSVIAGAYGGTGVANTGSTITLGGNLTTSGAYACTLTLTNTTSVTLPTSGTLVNSAVSSLSSLTTVGALASGSLAAGFTPVTPALGGTGLSTITLNNVILGNGTSTVKLVAPGTSGNVLTSDGTIWASTAPSGTMTLISTQTISSSTAALSVTAGIDSTYTHYIWEISNLTSVSNGVDAQLTVQQGGVFVGGTSYNYGGLNTTTAGAVTGHGSAGVASITTTLGNVGISNTSTNPAVLIIEFWQPSLASQLGVIFRAYLNGANNYIVGAANVATSAVTTGLKIIMSTGNIATCTANLYGVK